MIFKFFYTIKGCYSLIYFIILLFFRFLRFFLLILYVYYNLDLDEFHAFYKKFYLIDLYTDVCYKQYLPIKHCSCSIVNSSWITYFYIFLTFDLITIRSVLKNYNTRIEYGQIFFKNN